MNIIESWVELVTINAVAVLCDNAQRHHSVALAKQHNVPRTSQTAQPADRADSHSGTVAIHRNLAIKPSGQTRRNAPAPCTSYHGRGTALSSCGRNPRTRSGIRSALS